jgi:hypothetical protein
VPSARYHFADDIRQYSAVHQVSNFLLGIQTDFQFDLLLIAIAAMDNEGDSVVTYGEIIQPNEIEALIACELKIAD